jgi:citrate lyase beta subunit
MTIQPIIEHPKSLKIAPDLMQYSTVKHVVFGIHDFSKAMGIQITPRNWTEELKFYLHDILFEARIAGKGVIGAVETLIGSHDAGGIRRAPRRAPLAGPAWRRGVARGLPARVEEAAMGLSGKQVIHPSHIHPCKVAFTPSPTEIKTKIAILKAAIEADALLGGAIKFDGEMLDPADVRQGAADAAQGARAARARGGGHRLRDRGAEEAPEQVVGRTGRTE